MASNNSVINNSTIDKKNINILELKGKDRVDLSLIKDQKIKQIETCEKYSDLTTYQEIKILLKKENEVYESVNDTNQILKDPILGDIKIRGEYNKKREYITIEFLNIYLNKSYYKQSRKHFFIFRLYCKEKRPDWNSGYFKLTNGNPKQCTWIFENLLIENLKKSYFEVKLYRKKKNIKTRLLAEGLLDFVSFNKETYKPKTIILKYVYRDKPEKIVIPVLSKENKNVNLDAKSVHESVTEDLNEEIELKFSELKPAIPEILLGFEYNPLTNNLTVDVKKCINIYFLKGNNIKTSEIFIQLNIFPEKFKTSTNHFYQSHSPEFRDKFHFPISFANLKEGNIICYAVNHRTGRKEFFVEIDRNTNEHWIDMIMSAPNMVYMWHELSKYTKRHKKNKNI